MNSIMKWFLILGAFTVALYFLFTIIGVDQRQNSQMVIVWAVMGLAFAWFIFPLWSAQFLHKRGHDTWAILFVLGTIVGLGGAVTSIAWLVVLAALADPVVRD